MAKNKKKSGPPTRVHPELRGQGLLYRAGYGEIRWLNWDADGLWVATKSALLLLDPNTGETLRRLYTPIHGAARDNSGTFYTGALQLERWDGELVHQNSRTLHRGRIEDLSVSPDGQLLVTLGEDGQLLVSAGEEELRRLTPAPGSRRLRVDWNSRQAWVWGELTAELWDLKTGVRLQTSPQPPPFVLPSPWRVDDLGVLTHNELPFEDLEESLTAFVQEPNDKNRLALASERELLVVNSESGEVLYAWEEFAEWPLAMAPSPDGRYVASGGVDGCLTLRHLADGALRDRHTAHGDAITSLAFAPTVLFSGCADGTIRGWNWPSLEPVHELDGHDGPVGSLLCDGERLYSGSADGQILVWQWRSGQVLASLTGFEAGVESLQLAQGGEILLALYDDGGWCSWDVTRYAES